MTGYPETLTDPSYKSQILICTYPLLWNYGIPDFQAEDSFGIKEYFESEKVHIAALVVSEYSENYNHHEGEISLWDFLKSQKIPAITGIDTRELTQKLRDTWCLLGKIEIWKIELPRFEDPNTRLLSYEVCTQETKTYGSGKKKICLVDMGVKNNIIRNLLHYDTTIIRVPGESDFSKNLDGYDGIFLSNGPWDPALYKTTTKHIKKALKTDIPIFWICLGNQLLALAAWAKTYKLPYGHRWQNQPVRDTRNKECLITSQNHSYAIDESSLPKNVHTWFVNVNDGTNEGIYFQNKNVRSVQFHPESSPGPNDANYLFKEFIESL